jgi:hypothetical protein
MPVTSTQGNQPPKLVDAVRRVRVVRCARNNPQHMGKQGWLCEGEHTCVPDGHFMVNLDGQIDHIFGNSGLLCVASEIAAEI